MIKRIRIFTDGSCKANGHPDTSGDGGWAYIVIDDNEQLVASKYESCDDTTNNRMEMSAVIGAMKYVLNNKPAGEIYSILTDSSYVANGINDNWGENWAKNGWKTSGGKPVLNQDLWKELYAIYAKISCEVTRVSRRNPFTKTADKLAGGNKDVKFWFEKFKKAH